MNKRIVIVRHGQSEWNALNRFTGWVDVDLSGQGVQEARNAGKLLREAGYEFDIGLCSFLKRAVRTLWLVLDEMDLMHLPIQPDWRINERHYGALQGLDKKETVSKFGKEQVYQWRRGYAVCPPEISHENPMHPRHDPRYRDCGYTPSTESLEITVQRTSRWWREVVIPLLEADRKPIIAAHGNSLRGLVMMLDSVSEDEIMNITIPTGVPMVYELDADLQAVKHYYLGDTAVISQAIREVESQTGH